MTDDQGTTESEENRVVSHSPLLWSGPTCASERISTWTFVPSPVQQTKTQSTVFLLGLLIQPSTYIHTNGRFKYSIQIEPQKLFGLIRVKNVAFEKAVIVRCSSDKWSTFVDYPAHYLPPVEETNELRDYETFAFQISLPDKGSRFEFAIQYIWTAENNQTDSAWDNNNGRNYVLHNEQTETSVNQKLLGKFKF
ncbi:unnamed protein product [Echinostoma caproni]|uniref:CBM21 domain-containing protein n=1 Tax=Echinostoma caproni TaxID=27848 RepID=A0A183A589_9TREM|nr:unnamed protein product [Echinostoma caproni]